MSDRQRDDDRIENLAAFYEQTDTSRLDGDDVPIRPAKTPMVSRSIRFERDTMKELRARADEAGIGVTQLIRSWVLERLDDERRPRSAPDHDDLTRTLRAYVDRALDQAIADSWPRPRAEARSAQVQAHLPMGSRTGAMIAAWTALHDLGKANPGFLRVVGDLERQNVEVAGSADPETKRILLEIKEEPPASSDRAL